MIGTRVSFSSTSRRATPASSTERCSSGWATRCTCATARRRTRSALLGGHGCPLFEQAHGIVFKLDLGRGQHREILRRYRQLAREDAPIRVLVSPADAERHADLFATSRCGPTNPTSPISTGSPPGSRQPIG